MKTRPSSVPIAVIGISCWYPDAPNPGQLWENILARRRQFRMLPEKRLPISEYYHPDPEMPDKTYTQKAALIDGFDFDWASKRITLSTYESTDIAHWLALEVALEAVADAGFNRENIPRERTGVIVGNSLTGEQTRANAMRLRWPFVRRALRAAAHISGLTPKQLIETEERLEFFYKSVFPSVNEDTLAGGLSNTIAGRICNYLNVYGGGYTVDGACSSSLLAIATAATGLADGDQDLVLAGGVDISLDSFELIGFAKIKALAPKDMTVYDRRGNGFISGEGCGFVVLKRLEDAHRDNDYVYAVIHGWGISSDGKSTGITAPSASGQARAIRRAFARAPYDMASLSFIEGHGTGTTLGDRIELEGIAMAMGDTVSAFKNSLRPCAMTSLKSIIGHCKAASGIGGFIKAVIAVNRRVIPPTAGCRDPHPIFDSTAMQLYPAIRGEILDSEETIRAGVSAMGFGGINCHLTLESADKPSSKLCPTIPENTLLVSSQDTELFLLTADSVNAIKQKIDKLLKLSYGISNAELMDLAWKLSHEIDKKASLRCAIIAGNPEELTSKLEEILSIVDHRFPGKNQVFQDTYQKIWLGNRVDQTRVGVLFPGQGSQQLNMAKVMIERFAWANDMFKIADQSADQFGKGTFKKIIFPPVDRVPDRNVINFWQKTLSLSEYAQPAICMASAVWFEFFKNMGLKPTVVGGHSLGELTAFYAAGILSIRELFQFSALRGKAMAASGKNAGTMVSLRCSQDEVEKIIRNIEGYVVLANINGPRQVVLSGEIDAVNKAVELAAKEGIQSVRLQVSNAFHSKMASDASHTLKNEPFLNKKIDPPPIGLFSSYTGKEFREVFFLNDHFSKQILSPVDFVSMVKGMSRHCDIFLELGPGRILTGLVNSLNGESGPVCYPVESIPFHDEDLNRSMAALFIHGINLQWHLLFNGRLVRPFSPVSEKKFIENPCERPFANIDLSPVTTVEGSIETLANQLPGLISLSEAEVLAYLKIRGPFLAQVIEADLKYPAPENHSWISELKNAQLSLEKNITDTSPDTVISTIESTVFSHVGKITGYSIKSLTPQMRLLDDLNLDSIKAGDLIANIATALSTDTPAETLEFANATLEDIIERFSYALATPKAIDSEPSAEDALEVIMVSASEITGYPIETLDADALVTEELNISLEMLKKIIKHASQALKVDLQLDMEPLKERSLRQIALILNRMIKKQIYGEIGELSTKFFGKQINDLEPWVRDFKIETVETTTPPLPEWWGKRHEDNWQHVNALILKDLENNDIAQSLQQAMLVQGARVRIASFEEAFENQLCNDPSFSMLVTILPGTVTLRQSPELYLQELVEKVGSIASPPPASKAPRRRTTIAYIQFGGGFFGTRDLSRHPDQCCALSLSKAIHLERDDLRVRVFDFSKGITPEDLAEKVIAEINTPAAFAAVGFDHELRRLEQRPRVLEPAEYPQRNIKWNSKDVILVTGGARGISASLALGVARETGARIALLGSSPHPDAEPGKPSSMEIVNTLDKFSSHGLIAEYFSCDVRQMEPLQHTIGEIREKMGPVTGVIHGAGLNKPRPIQNVSAQEAMEEIGPKVLGILNLMGILEKSPPKILIGISSIIGFTGMPGNAWYGFSNEMLDILLRNFGAKYGKTNTLSVAFSIWRDEGMGYRMGSVESLKRLGIDAIPTNEGVSRFVRFFTRDPGTDRVVVTARLTGLDTFYPEPIKKPDHARYLENMIHVTPQVESIFKAHLTLKSDPYLADHVFGGSYLFPAVFGLEAMAQASAYVMEKTKIKRVRIENIHFKKPITVDPLTGTDIIIQAQVLERSDINSHRKVHAVVFKLNSDIRETCFSAEFTFDLSDRQEKLEICVPENPLDILPESDLYRDNLLFQGPMFQRIHRIFSIIPNEGEQIDEAKEAIFSTQVLNPETASKSAFSEPSHQHLFLGDPFFRDSLFQAGQILIPTVTCLPVFIEKIDIFSFSQTYQETLTGIVRIDWRKEPEIKNSVKVIDKKGFVRESIDGYFLHMLKKNKDNPFPEDLINPEKRDNLLLTHSLQSIAERFGILLPCFQIAYLTGLHQMPTEQRHEYELPLIRKVIADVPELPAEQSQQLGVHWLNSGKPIIESEKLSLDISLSHDERLCLCVAGPDQQGCDVAPITHRTRKQWFQLIGKSNEILLNTLLDAPDNIDCAGTRIWGVKEVIQKATGKIASDIEISGTKNDAVLFKVNLSHQQLYVLSHAINLTWGPKRVFSILVKKTSDNGSFQDDFASGYADLVSIQSYDTMERGGPQGQGIFIHRFPLNFKPNAQLSRTVYFSNYFFWLGEVREMSAWPILRKISEQFATGKWGLVTNKTHLKILGEATAKDQVEIRFWVSSNINHDNPFMDLTFDFRKILHAGRYERLAWCEQQVTWVKILDHGKVEAEPYPDYYWKFVKTMLPKYDAPNAPDPIPEPLSFLIKPEEDTEQYRAPAKPVIEPVLFEKHIETSLDHSNIVGNIYFANYYAWQGMVRDHYFYRIIPEYFHGIGEKGELLCLQTHVQHLREAMPFDIIMVTMALKLLKKYSVIFHFEYFKQEPDGDKTKLAFGEQENAWVVRDTNGKPVPSKFPHAVLEKFKDAIPSLNLL